MMVYVDKLMPIHWGL